MPISMPVPFVDCGQFSQSAKTHIQQSLQTKSTLELLALIFRVSRSQRAKDATSIALLEQSYAQLIIQARTNGAIRAVVDDN